MWVSHLRRARFRASINLGAEMTTTSLYGYYRTRWHSYRQNPLVTRGNTFGEIKNHKPDVTVRQALPGWKGVIAKGLDATNPYKKERFTYKPETIRGSNVTFPFKMDPAINYNVTSHDLSIGRAIFPSSQIFTSDDVGLRDLALARLKRKLSSHTKEFQALVPLAEVRDLRTTIVGVANQTMAIVKDLMRLKRGGLPPQDLHKRAADAWLTWSFGISPTLSDIENLQQSIATYLAANDYSVVLVGASKKDWKSSYKWENQVALYNANLTTVLDGYHQLSYKYTAGFNLDIKSANNYGLSSHLGFEWTALPSVAWELTAFSWIFDYFSTVGAFLEDAFQSSPTTTRYILLNRRYNFEGQISGYYTPDRSLCIMEREVCIPGKVTFFSLDRSKLPALPTRSLRFKSVDEIGVNSVARLLNLASLLVK